MPDFDIVIPNISLYEAMLWKPTAEDIGTQLKGIL